jgi:hypothetical protein
MAALVSLVALNCRRCGDRVTIRAWSCGCVEVVAPVDHGDRCQCDLEIHNRRCRYAHSSPNPEDHLTQSTQL